MKHIGQEIELNKHMLYELFIMGLWSYYFTLWCWLTVSAVLYAASCLCCSMCHNAVRHILDTFICLRCSFIIFDFMNVCITNKNIAQNICIQCRLQEQCWTFHHVFTSHPSVTVYHYSAVTCLPVKEYKHIISFFWSAWWTANTVKSKKFKHMLLSRFQRKSTATHYEQAWICTTK